jgi:hypothetical protein
MRKLLVLLPLFILPLSVTAQEVPRIEVYGGYSNLMSNLNVSSFDMSGVDFSAAENLNSWFGGALDISSHFGTENGFKTNMETAMYGPVFSYRKVRHVVVFSHGMLGAVRGGPNYLDISKSEVRFGALAGGGVDVQVSRMVALRLIQADYVLTHFSSVRQDNIRVSAGLVLRFGSRKK